MSVLQVEQEKRHFTTCRLAGVLTELSSFVFISQALGAFSAKSSLVRTNDKKLSRITLREPFKIIKDTSLAGKCPGMCRSQDSFRTFKEFDWGSMKNSVILWKNVSETARVTLPSLNRKSQ